MSSGKKRNILNSNLGFSLPEVMIAVSFLAITVAAVMTLVNNDQKGAVQATTISSSLCSTEVHNVMSLIREKSIIRTYVNFHPAMPPAAFVKNPYPTLVALLPMQEYGIPDAARWNGLDVYDDTAGSESIYPSALIMGTMTALDAIYRTATPAAICSTARGINVSAILTVIPPRNVVNDKIAGLQGAQSFLKIQPYDLVTGAVLPCADPQFNPVYTRPQNANRNNNAAIEAGTFVPDDFTSNFSYPAGGGGYKFSSNTRATSANHGWLVTSSLTYLDRTGRQRECKVQERFQYQPHPQNPLSLEIVGFASDGTDSNEAMNTSIKSKDLASPPSYNRAYTNPGDEPFYRSCHDVTPNRNVHLRVKNMRPGSVAMCRNLSSQRTAPFVSSNVNQTLMVNAAGPRRNAFHSSELLKNRYYYDREVSVDSSIGNMMVMGLYYPQGSYYCDQADGCAGLPYFGSGTSYNGGLPYFPYFPDYTFNDSINNGLVAGNPAFNWTPCEKLSNVCGVAIDSATSGYNAATGTYQIAYLGLPDGCDVHLQIAEVDAGYNIRATEFREYMNEKVPGNWLCRSNPTVGHGTIPPSQWFFLCQADAVNPPPGFVKCDSAITDTQECCVKFPTFPHYKAEHPSPP